MLLFKANQDCITKEEYYFLTYFLAMTMFLNKRFGRKFNANNQAE